MKNFFRVALALSLAVTLFTPAASFAQETIRVGIILPISGGQASFGEIEKNSFDLAMEEINAAGGVNGKKIEFLYEDDTGRPDVARSAAEKLINKDKVTMLGGGYGSSETMAIAGVAQQNRLPFLINTGSDDKITEKGWDYVFRLNPYASEYFKGLESFLTEIVKPQTCAILYENTNFGTSQSKAFATACERLGIKVVMSEGYEKGGVDFKPLLINVKKANPDLIYMISYLMDASLLMRQSMELQLNPKMFIGGGAGFTLPEFPDNAGKASEKVISVTLWYQTLPYPGALDYFMKYKERFKKNTEYHGAEAYSAAYVMANVLKRAKSHSPEDIKDALLATDMKTAFGPVKFVKVGDKINQNVLPTYVMQWIDGKGELVWPKEAASKPFVYPVNWQNVWK